MRFTREEISNLDAISLLNCPKLSDNPRIKTVEYTVVAAAGPSRFTYHCFGLKRLSSMHSNSSTAVGNRGFNPSDKAIR